MKIVATIWKSPYGDNSRVLVEMDSDELRKISGGSILHADVGSTLNVSDSYKMLRDVEDSKNRLKGAASTLRALADLCEQQVPQFVAPATEGGAK